MGLEGSVLIRTITNCRGHGRGDKEGPDQENPLVKSGNWVSFLCVGAKRKKKLYENWKKIDTKKRDVQNF